MVGRGGGGMALVRGRANHYGRSILVYIGDGGAWGIIKSRGSRVRDSSILPVELPAQSPVGALAHFWHQLCWRALLQTEGNGTELEDGEAC